MGEKKEHVEKIAQSKFNRQRAPTDVLRSNNGKEGYVFKMTIGTGDEKRDIAAGQCQFHHVLPVTSIQDGNILKGCRERGDLPFLHKCMAKTVWDVNEQPNLIGLPTKEPYAYADRLVAQQKKTWRDLRKLDPMSGKDAKGALPNLPCHLNDHDKFNHAVIQKLNKDLWPNLIDKRKDCKDTGKDIRKLLMTQSRNWKTWLKKRGKGAAYSWVNREKISTWYKPLSMAPQPRRIQPPPPNVYLEGKKRPKVKEWMKKMFAATA